MRTKNLWVLVGPSGSGKTTLAHNLGLLGISAVTTTTTRERRVGEAEDAYNFVSTEEFLQRVDRGRFAEYTRYADNWYGSELQSLDNGDVLVATPDGAAAVSIRYRNRPVITVGLMAPPEVLHSRLRSRGDGSIERLQADLVTFSSLYIFTDLIINTVTPRGTLREVLSYMKVRGEDFDVDGLMHRAYPDCGVDRPDY